MLYRCHATGVAWFVISVATAAFTAAFPGKAFAAADILDVHRPLADFDVRVGSVSPTARQKAAARELPAIVRWNRFGTPASLINYDGHLGKASGDDPVDVARSWLSRHAPLFRLSSGGRELELVSNSPFVGTDARAVIFRQRFGGLRAGVDGLVTLAVRDATVIYVSSSLAGRQLLSGNVRLDAQEAWLKAAHNVGLDVSGMVRVTGTDAGWTLLHADGVTYPQHARLVAVPTPAGRARPAYESLVIEVDEGVAIGYKVFVDAESGAVLIRHSLVDQAIDDPLWKFFTAYPLLDFSDRDIRLIGCWLREVNGKPIERCDMELVNDSSPLPWDVDPPSRQPNFTTKGNAASTALSSLSPFTPSDNYRPISPDREYVYPWTNYWFNAKCPRDYSPDMQRNDLNAAIVNLFAMHNRIHDWSYKLGFSEENFNLQQDNFGKGGRPGDPEIGNAAAGFLTGGAPTYTGRDNANQITPPDGISPVTNMYLWQPIAGAFYPPCVDGDFDMSVIVHEYTHAISNRMVGGPDGDLDSRQGGSMGESWSDVNAVEFLLEHDYIPVGKENVFTVGAYVTDDFKAGIRNYAYNRSPLNFSDVGYDVTGAQVHADGEIWSAVNYDIRRALIKKYNDRFPASDKNLQLRCAEGKLKPNECPGNRRWIQIVFDAWLLMQPDVTMVDARDAYLAADKGRFGGANQAELWNAFSRRGFGRDAKFIAYGAPVDPSSRIIDDKVRASFKSPKAKNEGTLKFNLENARGRKVKGKIFVGRYEARVTPIADTKPKTKKRPNSAAFVPGRYRFIAQAKGYGMVRFARKVASRDDERVTIVLPKNWASKANRAKAAGPSTRAGPPEALIDDTEATNWTGSASEIKGLGVTVDLAGGTHVVRHVAVSAMLRPRQVIAGQGDPQDPSQNRFTALRSFKILACKATKANDRCDASKGFRAIFTSPRAAFPSIAPRPRAPELIFRRFKVPATHATHVRLEVVTNQCTGTPAYQGEQDRDPTNVTDCEEGSAQDNVVRAAELQVFSGRARVR